MAVSWASKDSSETRRYAYSWLGRLGGAEIDTATLTIECGTVVLSSIANDATSISATVSGGADCEDAALLSTVVTTAGDTLEQAILLRVRPSAYLNLGPSTSTKRQLLEMAAKECSLAGYEFDHGPDELFSWLRDLDGLMAQWKAESLDLNYNAPEVFGQGDLEDYTGIPDAAIVGASISLAMAIAPGMGKTMSAESKARLSRAMTTIRTMMAVVPTVPYANGTIRGAGNRRWGRWSPFLPTSTICG